MKKLLITILFAVCFSQFAKAEFITISGHVYDADGALPGTVVIEQGTSNGVMTDYDGSFSIRIETGKSLEFKYIGYIDVTLGPFTHSVSNLVVYMNPDDPFGLELNPFPIESTPVAIE